MDTALSQALEESATSPHERENHPHRVQTVEMQSRTKPPGVFAGTFALLKGLRSVSYPPELPRGACHVDVESGTLNPQVVVTNAAGLTIGLRTSDGLVNPSPRMRSKPQTLAVRNESARARGGRSEPLQDGVHVVRRAPA